MMRELVLEPVARHRGDGAVAPLGALVGEGAELLEGVVRVGEPRRHHAADRDPVPAALGDLVGGADGLGAVGELALEVGGGAEPGVAGGETGGRAVGRSGGRTVGMLEGGERGVEMDGAEETVARPVLGVRRDDGVGGDDGQPEPARRGEDGVALLAGAELGVEVAGAARAEEALEEGGVGGEEDEAVAVVARGRRTGGRAVGGSCSRVSPTA